MKLIPSPLVSVIIPCFNHSRYLGKAIESVQNQSYQYFEIIVIDDGSIDNSKEVALSYNDVLYFYQENAGLSSARNRGIKESNGQFLVFLDADDLLCSNALLINLKYMRSHPHAAFVSGSHKKVDNENRLLDFEKFIILGNHYQHLLQLNYIGMHGAVMYRNWVFEEVEFDISLRACEDYDLYLKIARVYPVVHHQELIAIYRIHDVNMSGNIRLMLESVLHVLERQRLLLKGKEEKKCLSIGLAIWKNYYCEKVFHKIQTNDLKNGLTKKAAFTLLFKYHPDYLLHLLRNHAGLYKKRISCFFSRNGWRRKYPVLEK